MPLVPFSKLAETVHLYHKALDAGYQPLDGNTQSGKGNKTAVTHAMMQMGYALTTALQSGQRRLDTATALGIKVRSWRAVDQQFIDKTVARYKAGCPEYQAHVSRLRASGKVRSGKPGTGAKAAPAPDASGQRPDRTLLPAQIVPILRKGPLSLEGLAEKLGVSAREASVAVDQACAAGALIDHRGGKFILDSAPRLGGSDDLAFTTDKNGVFKFAACGDMHLGSKYERLDSLNDFYDEAEQRGITVVLNAGNWIDGEASFNRHDLLVHGMDNQMQYLAKNYPQRPGIHTFAVTGADHEGWYARREGVNVGKYAENVMRENGRADWHDVGYMERFIPLNHYSSGKGSQIHLIHPGGGSAYAISYTIQKLIESYEGGEKPSILLAGHYHKLGYNPSRNVHGIQTGCFMDQSVFMRQKRLAAHVGGVFIEAKVDPKSGAVYECGVTIRQYFNKGFGNGRWSQHGPVTPNKRSAKP